MARGRCHRVLCPAVPGRVCRSRWAVPRRGHPADGPREHRGRTADERGAPSTATGTARAGVVDRLAGLQGAAACCPRLVVIDVDGHLGPRGCRHRRRGLVAVFAIATTTSGLTAPCPGL